MDVLLKAAEIRKKIYGEENLRVKDVYSRIGEMYNEIKDYDKSLEYYCMSFNLCKSLLEENDS